MQSNQSFSDPPGPGGPSSSTAFALLQRKCDLARDLVCYALGVKRADLDTPSRGQPLVAFARQVAMYLTHVAFDASLNTTARLFARDRSTVAHACRLIEDKREDFDFDAWLGELERVLSEAPPPCTLERR
jgi:hypothetical protein